MQVLLAILFSVIAFQSDVTLVSASGEKSSGELVKISGDQVEFTSGEKTETFSFEQLAELEFHAVDATEAGELQVTLADGSRIYATAFASANGESALSVSDELKFEVENRNLQHVLLQPLASADLQSQWLNLVATPLESGDAVVVKRNGQLESLEGVVGKITADKVEFKLDDRSAEIDRKKIYGVIYYRAGRELPNAFCEITLVNGSTLQARSLEWASDPIEVVTTAGSSFTLTGNSIAQVNFAIGRAMLLGETTPTTKDWSPLMASSEILQQLRKVRLPRANRSYGSGPLDLMYYPAPNEYSQPVERREFSSGYAMVGGSKLVFALDGKFERLTGLVGFAPNANRSGNVLLHIRCDNANAFQQQLRNHDEQNPIELDINVKDVKRLVIEVDYHDGRAVGDTLHLCDLKVSR